MKTKKSRKENFRVASFLAKKSILHKKSMLIMITLIVGMGYLSTLFSASIMDGLKDEIENKAIDGIAAHVMLEPKDGETYIYGVADIEKKIYSVPHVVGVSTTIFVPVTLTDKYGNSITEVALVIDPDKERETTTASKNVIAGEFISSAATDELVIGSELTKLYREIESGTVLDVDAGKKITVTFPNGYSKEFVVKGVYKLGLMLTDTFVYISQKEMMDLFGMNTPDYASRISIRADERGHEQEIVDTLTSFGINAQIMTWHEKLGILYQFTKSLDIINSITSLIGVIIAFATVYIMIYINVMQKRSQIGIQKAMGIPGNTILLSYIIQSFVYGVVGAAAGLVMTLATMRYFTINPINMPMGEVVPVVTTIDFVKSGFILIASAVVAGYLAARGVIKDNILDAIFKG